MRTLHVSNLTAVVAAACFALAGPALAENPKVGGAEMSTSKNIVENASNSKDHTTLVKAVKAADLVETLSGPGPYTVFAPTDAAFKALPDGTLDTLLKPENKDQLKGILTYHVVPTKALSEAVAKMIKDENGAHAIKTVEGSTITAKMSGSDITLTDESGNTAKVTIADVEQSNGVIHVIDKVLMPKA